MRVRSKKEIYQHNLKSLKMFWKKWGGFIWLMIYIVIAWIIVMLITPVM